MNRLKFISLIFAVLSFTTFSACSGEQPKLNSDQQKKKVSFVQHLINYIEWPKSNHEPNLFYICVLGSPSDNDDIVFFDKILHKQKEVKTLTLKDLSDNDAKCDLVYVTGSNQSQLDEIFKKYAHKPVLLVSDIEDFSKQGGHVSFVKINNKFGAVLNTMSMAESGLELDLSHFNEIIVQPEEEDLSNSNKEKKN